METSSRALAHLDKTSDVSTDPTIYQQNVAKIHEILKSSRPDKKEVKRLMEATFPLRREWISTEAKSVKDILDKFPSLKSKPTVDILP